MACLRPRFQPFINIIPPCFAVFIFSKTNNLPDFAVGVGNFCFQIGAKGGENARDGVGCARAVFGQELGIQNRAGSGINHGAVNKVVVCIFSSANIQIAVGKKGGIERVFGQPFVHIPFQQHMFKGVLSGVEGESSAGKVVDKGMGKHISGGMGEKTHGHSSNGGVVGIGGAVGLIPQMAQPGIGALLHAASKSLRMDDLLPGGNVGVGIGANGSGAVLGSVVLQGGEDVAFNGIFSDFADDLAGFIVHGVDGNIAIV